VGRSRVVVLALAGVILGIGSSTLTGGCGLEVTGSAAGSDASLTEDGRVDGNAGNVDAAATGTDASTTVDTGIVEDAAGPDGGGDASDAVCPAVCARCPTSAKCEIDCIGTDACKDQTITCPPGRDCRINCQGSSSCGGNAALNCPAGQKCVIECAGNDACKGNLIGSAAASSLCLRCAGNPGGSAPCDDMTCAVPALAAPCTVFCDNPGGCGNMASCGGSCQQAACN
jgi:hypothetical protein